MSDELYRGLPKNLPPHPGLDPNVDHAPVRKQILTPSEERLALQNALRYFDPKHHRALSKEFLEELRTYGRIYMHRFRPNIDIHARSIHDYPAKSIQAAGIMLMLSLIHI